MHLEYFLLNIKKLSRGGSDFDGTAVDLSRDQKLLATAGKDRVLRIWDTEKRSIVSKFKGHVDTITSVKFDTENDKLYTVSADMTLKIWNMREMWYMDTHNGHLGPAFDLQAYSRDRVISCGDDRQVIFWKVIEDTQLLYKNTKNDTSWVSIIDDEYFWTGSNESAIDLWTFKKKKPIYKLKELHPYNNSTSPHKYAWINSIACVRNSDLLCSSSIDSTINFYKFNRDDKRLEIIGSLPNNHPGYIKGVVNSIKFSPKRNYVAFTHSDEEKLGRWFVSKPEKFGLSIVKLSFK